MVATPEDERRTLEWTSGQAVKLADGSVWSLPRFDLALLVTQPELVEHLRRILRMESNLARSDADPALGSRLAVARFTQYHTLAGQLLRINYELATDEWNAILPLERGEWFIDLVRELGNAIVAAIVGDWRGLAFSFLAVEPGFVLSN